MTSSTTHTWPSPWFFIIAGLLSLYAVWGVCRVPFHPDESTALFMSADFETFWSHPFSLAWAPGQALDDRMRYRMLDAPLSRHIVGVGRLIAGLAPVAADWEWGESWEQNQATGALPSKLLLNTGRLAITLLLPFSFLFIYLVGRQMDGEAVGLMAVVLLGLNALVLLHARRAMAEGPLLLGIAFTLWAFLRSDRYPWLAGLGAALAFNAKQSAIALLPVMLLAIAWTPLIRLLADSQERSELLAGLRKILLGWLQALGVFLVVTMLLNPFAWRNPVAGFNKAIKLRQELSKKQLADSLVVAKEQVAVSYGDRVAALLVNLFMVPPSFLTYGNNRVETAVAEQAPWRYLLRGVVGGSVMLALVLLGMVLSLTNYHRAGESRQMAIAIVWLATLALAAIHVLLIPLTWQRYVIPLVPLGCLWAAYGLTSPIRALSKNFKKPNLTPAPLE